MSTQESPPWEQKKKSSKRGLLRRVLIWGSALLLIVLVAYGLRPQPIPVELATLQRGPLTVSVLEEGKTRIRHRYTVSAPVTGVMRRISLRAGDEVKADETVLTVIDPTTAPLLDARSLSQSQARVQAAEAGKRRASESLEMAHTAARFSQQAWERVRGQSRTGSLSTTDQEQLEREALMRQQEARAATFALQIAEHELTQARAALIQQDATDNPAASVDVKAPISGRILRVEQESAGVVTQGTILIELGDPQDLEIEAEILSRDAVNIRPGAEVTLEQWGGPQILKGSVRRVEPAAFTKVSALGVEEQRVRVLSDLLQPPAEAQALGDRYRVEVKIAIWHGADELLVPNGALFREGPAWFSFVFSAGGKAQKQEVKVGRSDGRLTQVLEGLKKDDRVLLHPPDNVVEGSAVTATEKGK
jgi:HlyD family secretion protein